MGVRRIYASLVECVPEDPLILARLERTIDFDIYHQLRAPSVKAGSLPVSTVTEDSYDCATLSFSLGEFYCSNDV